MEIIGKARVFAKKIRGKRRGITAVLLSAGMIPPLISGAAPAVGVYAAESGGNHSGYTENIIDNSRVADNDTTDTYINSLINETNGSRYRGTRLDGQERFRLRRQGKRDGIRTYNQA